MACRQVECKQKCGDRYRGDAMSGTTDALFLTQSGDGFNLLSDRLFRGDASENQLYEW